MNEEFALSVEGKIVGVSQASGDQLNGSSLGVGADHDAARGLAIHRVSAGIFVARLQQIAFDGVLVRTARGVWLQWACVVAQDDVQEAVGAQHNSVRAMFAQRSLESYDCFRGFEFAVAILVLQPIERLAFRSVSGDEHVAVERQHALTSGHLVAVHANLIVTAVAVAVVDQQQRAVAARCDDVSKLVERHGDQRARLFVIEQPLDAEFLVDPEAALRVHAWRGRSLRFARVA